MNSVEFIPPGNRKWPHPGSIVRSLDHGHEGIVGPASFPSKDWMDGQSVPVTREARRGYWVTVYPFSGGAVCVAHSRLEIIVEAHEALAALHALAQTKEDEHGRP